MTLRETRIDIVGALLNSSLLRKSILTMIQQQWITRAPIYVNGDPDPAAAASPHCFHHEMRPNPSALMSAMTTIGAKVPSGVAPSSAVLPTSSSDVLGWSGNLIP